MIAAFCLLLSGWLFGASLVFLVCVGVYACHPRGRQVIRAHPYLSIFIMFTTSLLWPKYALRLLWRGITPGW